MRTGNPIVDAHTHLGKLANTPNLTSACGLSDVSSLESIRAFTGTDRMNIACAVSIRNVNDNPVAILAKSEFPQSFYLFAALDHSSHFGAGELTPPALADQIDRLIALGADGIKMIETKPAARKLLDIPVDSSYYDDYFARLEETRFPVLWHVADPEEFWDLESLPQWARECGWGYDETFVGKEQFYKEVERVLQRYPKLSVIFSHFLFLSSDLARASALLDQFEGVHLDITPGIELFYNLSKDPSAAREFFISYSDRIIFGTDTSSHHAHEQAEIRAGIISRWLETADEFTIPAAADFLLGQPSDGVMRGIRLPESVLARIYHGNFERLAGRTPQPLNHSLAAEECERIAEEVGVLKSQPPDTTLAASIAEQVRAFDAGEKKMSRPQAVSA